MFQSDYGAYDGDSWERMCQIALKRRYAIDGYHEIPAASGDFGLDGLTLNGLAFQCHCPDNETSTADLHDSQAKKIREDLKKLIKFEAGIKTLLNGSPIKIWHLVVPTYRKKELLALCRKLEFEYRSKGLSILSPDFEVHILDGDKFKDDIHYANTNILTVVDTKPDAIEDGDVETWSKKQIDMVENAETKHASRFDHTDSKKDEKVKVLVDMTVKSYLAGNSVLAKWEALHPYEYETLQRLVSKIEEWVVERCMFPIADKQTFFDDVRARLDTELEKQFPDVSIVTRKELAGQVVSRWIMECPLKFE